MCYILKNVYTYIVGQCIVFTGPLTEYHHDTTHCSGEFFSRVECGVNLFGVVRNSKILKGKFWKAECHAVRMSVYCEGFRYHVLCLRPDIRMRHASLRKVIHTTALGGTVRN